MPDFDDYKQCLFVGENAFKTQLLFQNKLHEVHTADVNKLTLSRNENKQVIQNDSVIHWDMGTAMGIEMHLKM